ncbi:MAG: hypothetical protein GXP25_16195 [Planctomycetes bacterium]|nr:hypothetical protein [Planctomycetota bacterium]
MSGNDSINPEERKLVARFHQGRQVARECPDLSDLAAYVDGNTNADETACIEAHLADCRECRRAVIETREIITEPTRVAPKTVLDAAMVLTVLRLRRWPIVARWTAAVAASFLIGLAGLLAGSSVYRGRQQAEEKVTSAITFDLVALDSSQATIENNVFEALVEEDEEVQQ